MKRAPLFITIMALMIVVGVLLWALPARDFSELENRMLAEPPAADAVTLTNGDWGVALEGYAADHFPARDLLMDARTTLHLLMGDVRQQNALAGRGGWLFEQPQRSVNRVAQLSVQSLNDVTEALGLPGTLLLIPTSAEIMTDALPALYTAASQQPLIDALYREAPAMACIDSTLAAHRNDAGLYYRTDHHLTARGAALCYEALCRHYGFAPQSFEALDVEGFLGSYFARMPSSLIPAETFSVYLPTGVTVTRDGQASAFMDQTLLTRRNKYAALFGGTYAHVVLENPQGEGSLLLICDSYANAIAPMLAAHFARVDMIDMRYYTGDLAALADEAGTTQLLSVYGLNIISTNRDLLLMDIPERRLP